MLTVFSEAAIGLILIALLISYLPTMYGAFSRRETSVTLLESSRRIAALRRRDDHPRLSHPGAGLAAEFVARLGSLVLGCGGNAYFAGGAGFFPIPAPGTILAHGSGHRVGCRRHLRLDSGSAPAHPQAELCIRGGYIALRAIADFFGIVYDPHPKPTDPISISREEYDAVYDELAEVGVPLRADRDQCWRDFAGWRVNYDTVLLRLAALTMAPYAPWISDRSILRPGRRFLRRNNNHS